MKEIGTCQLLNVLNGLQALTMALFTRVLGWEAPDVDLFLKDVSKDVKNKRIHSYFNLYKYPPQGQKLSRDANRRGCAYSHVVYGQKPESWGQGLAGYQ